MSLEAELKATYSQAHERLLNPPPRPKIPPKTTFVPVLDPTPAPQALTQSPVILNITRFSMPRRPVVDLNALLHWVALQEGVHVADLKSRCRTKALSHVRFIFYYLARKTAASSPRIAAAVGLQDHTSVLWGVKRCVALRTDNPDFGVRLDAYEAKLFPAIHNKSKPVGNELCCPYCGR